jgi:hypothetical protein
VGQERCSEMKRRRRRVMDTERFVGEVTSSKADRGFCFVQLEDGRSFFLHFKNIRDQVIAQPSDVFTFLIRNTPNKPGFIEAFDAVLLRRADKNPTFAVPNEVEQA